MKGSDNQLIEVWVQDDGLGEVAFEAKTFFNLHGTKKFI